MEQNKLLVHQAVLAQQLLGYCQADLKEIADFTLGYGGHAELLLQHFESVRLLGVDQDPTAIQATKIRLKQFAKRLVFLHQNFADAAQDLNMQHKKFNFIYADLGVSSPQLDDPSRGFSFNKAGPLDMRMNTTAPKTAEQVVNQYSKQELQQLLYSYGEERFAPRIVRAVLEARDQQPLKTTLQLAELVKNAVPRRFHKRNIHPATQTFQAIRMEVNQEQQQLKQWLGEVLTLLSTGGRLVVIAFHSLEDRLVKQCFANWVQPCTCPKIFTFCHCGKKPMVKLLAKKVVRPEPAEIQTNPRSRSARLRVVEKL